jgi:hypothetical protein
MVHHPGRCCFLVLLPVLFSVVLPVPALPGSWVWR